MAPGCAYRAGAVVPRPYNLPKSPYFLHRIPRVPPHCLSPCWGCLSDLHPWRPYLQQVRSARGGRAGANGRGRSLLDQDLVFEGRGGIDARMQEVISGGARAHADLRRQYSCFEIGDVNRDGYTAPKNRIDLCSEGGGLSLSPTAGPP